MGRKFTRLIGRQAIDRDSGGRAATLHTGFVFSHIQPRHLVVAEGADNLLTVSAGGLFRDARLFNAQRRDSMTDTKAKRRQMTVLGDGWLRPPPSDV